jgi:hypothetical protein
MSRLTGADALGLYEAYQAVYAPQELTEEQVWEEVETWVNSLIEEGYDLSDYTWEEMYEEYLRESSHLKEFFGPGMDRARKDQKPKPETADLKPSGKTAGGLVTLNRGYASTLGGQKGEVTYRKKDNVVTRSFRPTGMSDIRGSDKPGSNTPAKTNTPTATKTASTPPTKGPVLSKLNGVEGTGVGKDFKPRAFTDAEKSRYSSVATQNAARSSTPATAAAPKPAAAPAATTPTAPKPATGMLGKTSFERRTPTSAELRAAQGARDKGASPEKALQAAQKTNLPTQGNPSAKIDTKSVEAAKAAFKPTPTPKPVATPTPKPVATPTPKPVATPVVKRDPNLGLNPRERMRLQSFDLFDLVKGHLLDEGYADTEEAALAIMINMSEEWKQSIIKSI